MFPILASQKIGEVAAGQFAKKTSISAICVRLMGMFGPYDGAQLGLPARLVHADLSGRPPSFEDVFFGNADDAVDLLYIKDMARAIALLQTAEKLQYNVYNIASGKVTPNRELVDAVKRVVPNFKVDLPPDTFLFHRFLSRTPSGYRRTLASRPNSTQRPRFNITLTGSKQATRSSPDS